MTLNNGLHAQHINYSGGPTFSAQVWVGGVDERRRGTPVWMEVPLEQAPADWLAQVKDGASRALRKVRK